MKHFYLIFLILFLLFFSTNIIFAQDIFIGIDIFGELNGGWQNYSYLTYTAEDPWNKIFILHAGLRFSFFPFYRINNKIFNIIPLGLTLMVAYNSCNDFGNYDLYNTYLGRDYDLEFIRFTLMLGYGAGAVDFDWEGRTSYLVSINFGFYYSKFLNGEYWSDEQIKYMGSTPQGFIADDFGIRIELYGSFSIGISKGISFIGISASFFVDINLKDLITSDDEKLTYWSLGVNFGWPIHF